MPYECTECNGTNRAEVVCHHCGKPLCRQDGQRLIDEAFSDVNGDMGRTAWHCSACQRRHHPRPVKPEPVATA